MKNLLAFSGLVLILGLFACKKEQTDNTQLIVESGKPAPPSPQPSILFQWQQCIGTPLVDFGNAVSEASDGYYVVGAANNSDVRQDALISKLDISGNVIKTHIIYGSGTDVFNAVVTTDDGGCLAAGTTSSPELKGPNGGDILLVKYSSSLDIEWTKTIGGSGGEAAFGLIRTADGGFALAGRTSSTDGDVASSTSAASEIWLVRFNISTGTPVIEWETKVPEIPESSGENGYAVAEGVNGDFTVVGTSYYPEPDIRIIHTDNSGHVDWTKRLGASGVADIGWGIAASNDNAGFVITGTLGNNIWVYKVASNGGEIWQKTFRTGSARSIVSTSDGNIIVGLTGNKSGDVIATKGGQDLFVLRLNHAGTKLSSHAFGGNRDDAGKEVIRTSDGGYIAVGETNSNNNGNVFGNHGTQDIWVMKFIFSTPNP